MTRTPWRVLAAGLLAALTLAFAPPSLAAPPGAPPAPPPDTGQRVTFGVRPATAQAPDERSGFTYSATPGARLTDYVAVSNVGETPLNLRVYASDAFNTPEGGFDLLASTGKPVDIGAWAKSIKDAVTVPARSVMIVPFSLTIPANASPGDHAGGIVAALTTEQTAANGQKVAVEQRVGARIYLRVTGDLHPRMSITDLAADYSGNFLGRGDATLSYTVRNIGNTRLTGAQWAKVSTPWGSSVDAPALPRIGELLPGGSIRMTTKVAGLLPTGWLTGTVHVDPAAVPGHQDPAPVVAEASVTIAAVPWLLVVVLLVLLLLILLWWLRRRRRKASANTTPTPPQKADEHAAAH
jgi:hypothetical protein